MTAPRRCVVCGVDGSDYSLEAAEYAVQETLARNLPLRFVHASEWLRPHPPPPAAGSGAIREALRRQVDDILAAATDCAAGMAPGLTVATEILPGAPAAALVEMSHSCGLLVVGSRGLGSAAGMVAGSVSVQVATHAYCPVVVVRHARHLTAPDLPPQPVVVGVDGALSAPAVDFAFETAAAHGVPLIAIHAWRDSVTARGSTVPLTDDVDAAHDTQARFLASAIAEASRRHPAVPVEEHLVRGTAQRALVDASSHARLVVVGSRGQGGFLGLHLGSVSHAVLHHAHCPVAVVRSPM